MEEQADLGAVGVGYLLELGYLVVEGMHLGGGGGIDGLVLLFGDAGTDTLYGVVGATDELGVVVFVGLWVVVLKPIV